MHCTNRRTDVAVLEVDTCTSWKISSSSCFSHSKTIIMATEVETVIQGLECCLCFHLLEEPKLLSCTHSFCEKCLQLLHNSQGKGIELSCPLCRQITPISNKDVSSLKTNVPLKSMVGDVKTGRKLCTLCDPEDKFPAVYYCLECDEYMCDGCMKGHGRFKKNASHVVVSVDDIKSGKMKVKQMCHKHAGEERLWVCTTCKVPICFRCRMLDHNGSDHVVDEVEDFKKKIKEEIESLKKRGMEKMEKIRSYTKIVQEQTTKVEIIIAEREADINKVFDETLLKLNAKKNALLDQCKELKRKLTHELSNQGKNGEELITSLSSTCELVGNGVKTLLEGEALEIHHNLCKELKDMLDRDDPDESKSKQVTVQAEAVTFTPCRLDDEHYLGMLNMNDWELEKVAEFHTCDREPWSMSSTKDGKMLVGYFDGGIEEFTVTGSQKTVLNDVKVMAASALSDGRFVVRNIYGKISLYSSEWNKLDIRVFKMRDSSKCGGMDADLYNNIYVGNYKANTIYVFKPEGGTPIREIPCHGYSPYVICTMNHSNLLVVSDGSSVRVIDQQGRVQYDVTKKGYAAHLVVLHDDSILIGWEKHDHVTIDLYTNLLRHVRTVKNLQGRYYPCILREFSKEIAVCTFDEINVYRKRYTFR